MTGTAEIGPIARHLTDDHARLDALLARAMATPGVVERGAFDAFRAGLLRHIALEEKILLPAVRRARGESLPEVRQLRIEHGALASLLVPTPTPELVAEIQSILVPHDAREEGPGGVYDQCDRLLGSDAEALVARMRAYPPVRVAPYADGPRVLRSAEDALRMSARSHGGR
ncbi:MAG TPA: hemerythrin domain-containing protein [Anaeromyxobacter sp.]|nr:hemerythrin domain-containing protein [Anaeromyxobacter sp.]